MSQLDRCARRAGAAINRPLRNWLEMSPRTVARAAGQSVGVDHDRRAAVAGFALRVRAELPQRIEQIANRPLAHPRDAVEPERAVPERHQRREKPHRRAAVGTEQVGFDRRNPAGRARRPPAFGRRRCDATAIPSSPSAAIITRVSSLSSAPRSVDAPSASAAHTSARLVMLFDPGGRTRARDRLGDGLNFDAIPT